MARKGRRVARGARAAARRRYHHGNLRQALIEAALELVTTQGVDALTLRAAARKAGVSQAAPYRHFASKEALLAAVSEEGFRAMAAVMREALASAGDAPLAQFHALGRAYIEFARAHPSQIRVMFGRELADRSAHPPLQQAAVATYRLLVDAIADCQRAGLVRAGDPEALAVSAWSMVHGFSALVIDGQLDVVAHRSIGELAESVAQDMYLGLAERPAPPALVPDAASAAGPGPGRPAPR
jgi:AcrR family transcriptional regulator